MWEVSKVRQNQKQANPLKFFGKYNFLMDFEAPKSGSFGPDHP